MHVFQPLSLPEGGTAGEVLTKTGPGEEDTAWRMPEVTAETLAAAIDACLDDVGEFQKQIGPGGHPVTLSDLEPGDLLRFSVESAWVNVKANVLTDGGNF